MPLQYRRRQISPPQINVSDFDIAVHRVIEGFFDFVDMDLPRSIDDIGFFFVYRTLYFGKTAFVFGVA